MAANELKFLFKGFTPTAEFEAYANERLAAVVRTGPFGATAQSEIELTPTGYKTTIKMNSGSGQFHGASVDSDVEHSLQRCLGQVRSKTFKWRKDKLAAKNKPREKTAAEKADPLSSDNKKFYKG